MNKYEVQPLDLMQYINTKYHEPFIHERIEFDGALDGKRLAEAVDLLIGSFPILKCGYIASENVFFENENISGKDLVKEVESSDRNILLTESLDLIEKQIQFTIFKNELYVTVSHLICDGSGFKQLLYLLCDAYNGKFGSGHDYLMKRNFSQLTEGMTGRGRKTIQMLMAVAGNYRNKQIYSARKKRKSYVIEKTIPKEVMGNVHAAAKKQGATLNDVFLTAYARAICKMLKINKVNIPCTVDLRKYAKDKTGIANLTGTYNLNVKLKPGEVFGDTLSKVSANMQKQKKTCNDIVGPMLLVSKYEKSSLEKFLKLYGNMDTSAFTDYTNLGILDDKRLIFDGVTVKNAVGYSVLSKSPCFQLAVSSFKGETTFSCLFQCSETAQKEEERLVEYVVSELHTSLFNVSR